MHCTSGTTGTPKGVWSGLLSDADAAALVAEERSLWGFADTDVNLVLSPLYHSAPLRFAMGTALAGGRVVVPGPFDPALVTEAIERERPTSMFCVPTHLQRLFAHWDEVGTPDLSSFRLVAHAGAPCPDAVKRRLVETFPEGSTWEFYGSTEGQFTACRSEEWLEPARHGRPGPARAGCCPPTTTARSGARCRRSPGSPTTATPRRPRPPGGTPRTGRRSPSATSAGSTTTATCSSTAAARTWSSAAASTSTRSRSSRCSSSTRASTTSRCTASPTTQWGQRVCAAYVGAATPAELDAFVRERLAPPKRPKTWHPLPDLPRTLTGKVLRQELPG